MAKFIKIKPEYYLDRDKEWYQVDGNLNEDDINKINTYPKKIVLVINNTKGIDSNLIKRITSSNVEFSVVGGLNYLKKKKFQDMDYIDRTILTPIVLAKVIEYFEKIESKIRYSWTETQKCMYIYKTLVENLHYKYDNESDYEKENGIYKDVVRSLYGLLYGRLVCSGFALVFKEALDRIGIKNVYQNKQGHHSWNIASLDGKIRALELTWDCYNKGKDNQCTFNNFGLAKDFYGNKHHDISKEGEEKKYEIIPFTIEELRENYQTITSDTNSKSKKMDEIIDNLGNKIYYKKINNYNNINTYMVYLEDRLVPIYSELEPQECLTKNKIVDAVLNNQNFIPPLKNNLPKQPKRYTRKDNSDFVIVKNQTLKNNMHEHYYYDVIKKDNEIKLRRGVILSEIDLSLNYSETITNTIANNLLGKERLKRKMLYYNGYVGYLNKNGGMYYNDNFEKNELNIYKRK